MLTSLSAEELRSAITYYPEAGSFVWEWRASKSQAWNTRFAWKQAGSTNDDGYLQITIDRVMYKGHRLAWLFMTGRWPERLIDHINGDRADNRWVNLRQVSFFENGWNRERYKFNKKPIGIALVHGKWHARITHKGERIHLGAHDTQEEAGAAYMRAAKTLRGCNTFLPRPNPEAGEAA